MCYVINISSVYLSTCTMYIATNYVIKKISNQTVHEYFKSINNF